MDIVMQLLLLAVLFGPAIVLFIVTENERRVTLRDEVSQWVGDEDRKPIL